ncbi:MAG: 4'-phosphopantetheinyl transferase superfamily protein [Nostocales cyanobacterium]|nr:MAG: 4'-phosphopantetheinyl transferase superfamily protein [Nostocales cyanobacterium]
MVNHFPSVWLPAPQTLSQNLHLSSHDVHIWKINLKQSEAQVRTFQETLSSDEIARAKRFYFPEHQQRFIIGRGSLRMILGSYLNIEPQKIEFDYHERGKPFLAAKFQDSGLFFNLSHSQDLGLLGVSYQRLIGVDLEYMRPMSDLENLAQRFFLPAEYEIIKSLNSDEKQKVFFRYWTCKEAYLKATGDGLVKLENIGIDLKINQAAQLLFTGNWQLQELTPADNFAAAVVVANDHKKNHNFHFWQYQ